MYICPLIPRTASRCCRTYFYWIAQVELSYCCFLYIPRCPFHLRSLLNFENSPSAEAHASLHFSHNVSCYTAVWRCFFSWHPYSSSTRMRLPRNFSLRHTKFISLVTYNVVEGVVSSVRLDPRGGSTAARAFKIQNTSQVTSTHQGSPPFFVR